MRVLESLASRVQTAIADLRRTDRTSEGRDALWDKVDHAKRELAIVAETLKHHKETPQRTSVVEQMRQLESELTEFTATLPSDKRPLYYDSGMNMDFFTYLKR